MHASQHPAPDPCPVLSGARTTATPPIIRAATDQALAEGRGTAQQTTGARTRLPQPPAQKNPSMQRQFDPGEAAPCLRGTHPSHTAL